jgi:hypothetical protein
MAGVASAHEFPSPLPMALFVESCAFRIAASAALAHAGVNWQLAYSGSSITGLCHAVACSLGGDSIASQPAGAGSVVD